MERRDKGKEGFVLGILEMCEGEIIREKRASYITAQSPPDSFSFSFSFIHLFIFQLFLFSLLRIYSLFPSFYLISSTSIFILFSCLNY